MKRKAFLLRLDPTVYEAVERLAQQELRSINGQIEYLLREALKARGRAVPTEGDRTDASNSHQATDDEPDESA